MGVTGTREPVDCIWIVEEHPFVVEYARSVLEGIRLEAVDGLNLVRHGGIEVGGILWGAHESGVVRVLEFLPLKIEYATGPNFVLSGKDREALGALLSDDAEYAAKGLEAVGWYHSHTRSGIALSPRDLEIYNDFFPKPWQVALVIRPANLEPSRAGFFFREADGRVRSESSYKEIILPRKAAEVPAGKPETAAPLVEEPQAKIEPQRSVESSREFTRDTTRKTPGWKRQWKWYAIPLLLLPLGLIAVRQFPRSVASQAGLGLSVTEAKGMIRIDWDRNSPAVKAGKSGTLEITDGAVKTRIPLDAEQLHKVTMSYVRKTGDLKVALNVHLADRTVEELARFAAPPETSAPISASPVESAKPESGREAEMLRLKLQQQNDEMARMARTLDAMRAKDSQPERRITPATLPARPAQKEPASNAPVPAAAPPEIALSAKAAPEVILPPSTPAAAPIVAPGASIVSNPLPVEAPPASPRPNSAGRLIWTGRLPKEGTVTIERNRASAGAVSGSLPGVPVRVNIYPGDLTSNGLVLFTANPQYARKKIEPPGAGNGWNRTEYTFDAKRARSVQIVEAPRPENGWSKLALRGNLPKTSVVVVEWSGTQ